MSQSAYIKLVEGSEPGAIGLAQLKHELLHYKEQTDRTGRQLGWDYAEAAFPYEIETAPEGEDRWFYLKGTHPNYKFIIIGISADEAGDADSAAASSQIQIVLPDGSTHGDKAKANEFCRSLGKKFKAELHLFNGRVMYFNPRK